MENKNRPAFPITESSNGGGYGGLTKREYFAAKAMLGKLNDIEEFDYDYIAKSSVKMADALIKALEEIK